VTQPETPAAAGLGILLTNGTGPTSTWGTSNDAFAVLESSGCSIIWLADHLAWGEPMPEALTTSAFALAATTRCLVGTGVLQLPLRSVAAVAKASTTLAAISGGRFLLGVGAGEHRSEYDRVGATFERRGAQLDAGIAELRRFWAPSGDRFEQRPAPTSMPIWVGGRSDRAIQRTARFGDGWLPIFLPPDRYREAADRLDHELVQAGRGSSSVVRGAVMLASVEGSGWSRREAVDWAARLWAVDPGRLERHIVTGTADDCAAAVGAYHAAGADHVALLLTTDRPISMFGEIAARAVFRTSTP
jgi:alkanesulfonate monooxygenase SsuD/methylene tetrahydromethanopterin reductase-like flavin-dependent oxidoreductase (luciferase family)